jgi:hypothetical protein
MLGVCKFVLLKRNAARGSVYAAAAYVYVSDVSARAAGAGARGGRGGARARRRRSCVVVVDPRDALDSGTCAVVHIMKIRFSAV